MRTLDIPALAEDGEPARAALIALAGGAYAIVQVTGVKSGLIVEAEVIGDEGRLLAREDRGTLTLERFEDSPHYAGYRQLGQAVTETVAAPADFSPFIAIAEEMDANQCLAPARLLELGQQARNNCGDKNPEVARRWLSLADQIARREFMGV